MSSGKKRNTSLGASLTISIGRDDATHITSASTTRKETTNVNALQRFAAAESTYGRRRSRLNGYHDSFVGQETTAYLPKLLETFLQTADDELRHLKMKRTAH